MQLAGEAATKKTKPRVDPIRLNLFFDLISSLGKAKDFDALGKSLGIQLRFVVDFDNCYFILGDPEKTSHTQMYSSTKASPRPVLTKSDEIDPGYFEAALHTFSLGIGAHAGATALCLPLISEKGLLGALIITRQNAFDHSEYRFVEAISEFLAPLLNRFLTTEELIDAHVRTQEGENHQKFLVHKLEEERELREKFVSALSHDLRSPLTTAKLAAQLITMKFQDPESIKSLSLRVVANIDRIDRMILDLLDANRIKSGGTISTIFEECVLDQIIFSIVDDLNQVYGHRFHFHPESKNVVSFCDRGGLQRILENLATNAIKYGSLETPIFVTLELVEGAFEISVHNEGPPISAEDQKTVFGQFSRTASAIGSGQKGWGIGLSLVKAIAFAHQGSVRVESSLENGTTFFVQLSLDPRVTPPRQLS